MVKNLLSIILTLNLVFSLALSVSAAYIGTNKPYYDDTKTVILELTYSSNGAVCYGKIIGNVGTSNIDNCNFTLKDSKGNEVQSWTNLSATGSTLMFSETSSAVTKGEKYTLSVTADVHRNGGTEHISGSITAKYN